MDKRGKRKNRSKSQGDLDDYEIGNSLNLKLTYGRKEYEGIGSLIFFYSLILLVFQMAFMR